MNYDDGDGDDRDDDWDDDRDWYDPDPEDAESARWLAEQDAHFEEVHGGSGVCDCRPLLRNRVKWRIQAADRRMGSAWWRARCALRNPWTFRAGPAEITIRLNRHRSCACAGRGWFYHKTGIDPMPMPEGYDGVSLCSCGSAIGQLADSRRALRKMVRHERGESPF